jgi:hypothetical protein
MRNLLFASGIALVIVQIAFADTIASYLTSACLNQNLSKRSDAVSLPNDLPKEFSLENDTLKIGGQIRTNCCGQHLIIYTIIGDSIIDLRRLDKGGLCDCDCPFAFKLSIPGCTSPYYHVKSENYFGDFIDTIIEIQIGIHTSITTHDALPSSRYSKTAYGESAPNERTYDILGRDVKVALTKNKVYIRMHNSTLKHVLFF